MSDEVFYSSSNEDRKAFLEQMQELVLKSRNKYLRSQAIKYLEKYGNMESIDMGCANYIRSCK
jgi:hypothetical protein